MKRRNVGLLMAMCGLLMAVMFGCGDKEGGSVVSTDEVIGEVRQAKFGTPDAWTITGDLYEPAGKSKGGVLLMHQRGGSAEDWHALCIAIKQAGFTALAMDQRGTGRSSQGPGQSGEFAPWNTVGDIEGGLFAMKGKGPIMLIGASYGANNALLCAAAHPDLVRSLVLFSPSTDYHGLKTTDAVKKYTGPLLIFHQKGDKIAGEGPARLDQTSGSKDHKLQINEGTGHGVALLNAETTQQTVDFIVRTLK